MSIQFLDGKLLKYLSDQGVTKAQANEWFVLVAIHVSELECEANPEGELRYASWKRIYHTRGSVLKTLLCLPLLAVGWLQSFHDEQTYTSAHRLDPRHLRGYYLRRFLSGLMQLISGLSLIAGIVAIAFLIAYYFSNEGFAWEHLYSIPTLLIIGLCAKGFKASKRFGLPTPLRIYGGDGLFEFSGLQKPN